MNISPTGKDMKKIEFNVPEAKNIDNIENIENIVELEN